MANSTIGIDVRANADFSDVERAAAKTARTVSQQYANHGPAGRSASGFGRVFKDASRDIADMERRLQSLQRTAAGLDLLNRVKRSGQDPGRPGSWNWDRLGYGAGAARDAVRRRFEAGWDGPMGGPAGPSAWAQRMGQAGQTARTAAGEAAVSFAGGVSGLPVKSLLKGGVVAAAVLGALKGGMAVKQGYDAHLSVIEDVDRAFKAMRSTLSFDGLTESVRGLAQTLDITSEEGARLAATYQRQSGALDAGMVERAESAGAFGRGLGLDPNASAGLMARAELLGVGANRTQQREFVATLAHGIAQSGMGGRSEQYLEMMVGHIEQMAQSQARGVSMGEIGRYNALMGGLLSDPALRGGGAQTIYGALKATGSGSGIMQEALKWEMFGDAAGNDPALVQLLSELEPHQSLFDVMGYGSKATRMELTEKASLRQAAMFGGDPLKAEALLAQQQWGTPMTVTIAKRRAINNVKASGVDFGAFSQWAAGQLPEGMTLDDINPAGLGNLAKLYAGRNDSSDAYVQWMKRLGSEYADDSNISQAMRGKLTEALDAGDIQALRTLLPEIAAYAGQQRTDADRMREANSDLAVSLERLGSEAMDASVATKKMQEALTSAAQWMADNIKQAADIPQTVHELMQDVADAVDQKRRDLISGAASRVNQALISATGVPLKLGAGTPPPNLRVMGEAREKGALDIDPMLIEGARLASMANPDLAVRITSGNNDRPQNPSSLHPHGKAMDLQILKGGKPLPSLRNIPPEAARAYEKFGQDMYALTGEPFVWGGYFKSGDWYMDARHYQIGGPSAGGNLATGAKPDWSKRFGNFSEGWIGGSIESHREALLKDNPALRAEVERLRKEGLLKYHSGGIVRPLMGFGAEVPALLQVGEEVLTDRDPRHRKNLPPATAGRMTPEHAINARWQGALEMNVVFRDARGNVVQQRNALAVSEPRIPGSGPAQRFAWTDSVIVPG